MTELSPELQRLRLEQRTKSDANWFYWIAGLSLINSVSVHLGSTWGFIAGLGIAQVVDALFRQKAPTAEFCAFLFHLLVTAVLIAIGYLAHQFCDGFIAGIVIFSILGYNASRELETLIPPTGQ